MKAFSLLSRLLAAAVLVGAVAVPAVAQITTGTVTGTIKDEQGLAVPGATVVLVSETRQTRSAPAVTGTSGDFVFPNVSADTYAVEVTMDGFRTTRRGNVAVSGGDRIGVGDLTLSVGGASETVTVTGDAPLIQSQSGERSFRITTTEVENLPIGTGRNFATLTALTPGVTGTTTRLGGGGQNNIMMDGVSTMDTGNNGQLLQMNPEAIAEVKVLTAGYQAEYGRSSGLQITAVTKGGSNQFHGSLYGIMRNSDWNSNSWVNQINGTPKQVTKDSDYGYSFGGPVGRPGGENKLFFFYSQEYRPRTSANILRQFRVPTALERQGDFSQTRDNNGNLFNLIRGPAVDLAVRCGEHCGVFSGRRSARQNSAGPALSDGHQYSEALARAEHHAGARDELQPRVPVAAAQDAQLPAGRSSGLPVLLEAADDGEIHGPEGIPRHHAGNDSRIQRHLQRVSVGACDRDDS